MMPSLTVARPNCHFGALLALWFLQPTAQGATPLAESWDYAAAMREVVVRADARPGVVLHIGDSITYSNPYGQWARMGQGQSEADRQTLRWMHTGDDDDRDGWWLCRFDHPAGERSYTACGGMTLSELLAGGRQELESLDELLAKYRPQIIVLMIGTNDASHQRAVNDYRADLERAIDIVLGRGVMLVLSTIPPHPGEPERARKYNEAIRELAEAHRLPLIDYEREILLRRPDDWNGSLLTKNDVHPTTGDDDINAASEPTDDHLRRSGYLLRGWLSVRKIAEVKQRVLDAVENEKVSKPSRPPRAAARSRGQGVRLPVTRDTWFSNVGREADGNTGGADKLKLKSIQEMSLVDFSPAPLRGRVVRRATLHLRRSGAERLWRVTVGSFAAPWVEGTATGYAPQVGSSTHNHRQHPDVPWSYAGSDLCDVMLGRSGTIWQMADATDPDADGWQEIDVDPHVVAARVAGISEGCLVFDDTGSEFARDGEEFTLRVFPNRFIFSREAGKERAPYFTAELGEADRDPPGGPERLSADAADLPAGEAWLTWTTPEDAGPAGTIGFFVQFDGREAPRYLVPRAGEPGEMVSMHVRDLGLAPGAKLKAAVSAVDGAGNRGPAAELAFNVSAGKTAELPPDLPTAPKKSSSGDLPHLGQAEFAVIDALDKAQPATGELTPNAPADYLRSNHLWSAKDRTVTLHAARNEFVDFQVVWTGEAPVIKPKVTFDDQSGIKATIGRLAYVETARGPLPDAVLPEGASLPKPAKSPTSGGGFFVEVYVPREATAGEHRGTLRLAVGKETLDLPIVLTVWDFTLPDYLSFLPEMNCYGLPDDERSYYRLANLHRTMLNRVPYHQNGQIAPGCAPKWDGRRLDWTEWDRRFGQYFDGSAFDDLPRRGVPLEGFYLPLHENWPSPMEGNYNGSYWADQAFPAEYRRAFVEVSRQMAEHFNQRGWHDTLFQCFQNGKNNFKENGWSRGSSPWLLDEPANFQDYWALRWFGLAFHEGADAAAGRAKLVFRCDISRPEWQRDSLDDVLDYNVVGGAFRRYRRMVLDRQPARNQLVIEYGSANAIEDSNVQPAGWCVDAWSLGADGVLPWQTIGRPNSWDEPDRLSLFYPAPPGSDGPAPSLRLKAFRRGQQDVEYLTLWMRSTGLPRWAVGEAVRQLLRLTGERKGTGAEGEDAGVIQFANLRPRDLWQLRTAIGNDLSAKRPAPARRLVDFRPAPQ